MDTQILPQIDMSILQDKANEYALKGAIECIKEYYTGYNSPFKKEIETELSRKDIDSTGLHLPDIMALINDQLTKEIDVIANQAVSKSFVPLVSKFLTRVDKEVLFSQILKEFIEATESEDSYDCSVNIKEDSHGWLDVRIQHKQGEYRVTLHQDYSSKKESTQKYQILSLPYGLESNKRTMKLTIGEGTEKETLEMPFTTEVLEDAFVSYIARLILSNSLITMDCRDFEEEWFHDEDGCRCH